MPVCRKDEYYVSDMYPAGAVMGVIALHPECEGVTWMMATKRIELRKRKTEKVRVEGERKNVEKEDNKVESLMKRNF